MEWYVGDKLRVLNVEEIFGGEFLDSAICEVIALDERDGTPIVSTSEGNMCFFRDEMQYVERVTDEEYEMSDAELGEPSADCNCECDCGNLAEELADIKAMIGRLIRNGGDEA